MIFTKIDWAPNETLFEIGSFGIHYYSLMFIMAFGIGYFIMKRIYENEGRNLQSLEPLFVYMIVATFLGARLGDVLFYNWDYYQSHLIEILLPIKERQGGSMLFGLIDGYQFIGFRGLASHGATIGIIIGMYFYQKRKDSPSLIWLLDRLPIPVAIGGAFVRFGNFFNSEIVGKYTHSNFGVVFVNNGDSLPRHPAQLYEAILYLILFFVLHRMYYAGKFKNTKGKLLGLFFICLFSARFLVEFVKESQGGFEAAMPLFSTGQWLSIPFIVAGIYLTLRPVKK